ncbi:hypothetical protein GPECTOR_43g916 [Gonium pectorale]|uniref:Uncharacterized protein n=1 Tax=Gonium pectorale TaxID=33097 RepID=A0A150GAU7_GONPE|nr:hypothetical protein GPECTOR_43g916 [Gonium pectorale]|eukprot:KXZ46480.1 hypothetical protein GPECTOR_43g916 [Gonium pectorale]
MLRRSMSVGKGRAGPSQPDEAGPRQAASRAARPALPRASSSGPAPGVPPRRDTSTGRVRIGGGVTKADGSLLSMSKLTTITEAPSRPGPHAASTSLAAPARPSAPPRPGLSLNLSAVKQQQQQPPAVPALKLDSGASQPVQEESGPPVPKLNLGGILQRRAEEQALEPVFVVAASEADGDDDAPQPSQPGQHDKRKSGSRAPSECSAKEEPPEHFYLYPKVNQQEKKRIEDICRVIPKRQQAAVTDLFSKMVEARQNCEQMAFRGHRLLDQAQAEFKNRLAAKEEEAAQWRQQAELLRTQLGMLLGQQLPTSLDGGSEGVAVQEEQSGGMDAGEADLRNSLLSTFDRMAWGSGGGDEAEATGQSGPAQFDF